MPNVSVVLDTDDRVASLAAGATPDPITRAALYACKHTILVGKLGANYAAVNFNINYDLLDKVFEAAGYGDQGGLAITEDMCQLFRYKPPVAAGATPPVPRDTRSKDASFVIEKRGRNSRAFMGQRIKFKMDIELAAKLYPTPFKPTGGTAKPRKGASMLFPNLATINQIACWMSLNLGTVNRGKLGKFVTQRGSGVLLKSIVDIATLDKQIGSFKVATKNKLQEVPVQELNP